MTASSPTPLWRPVATKPQVLEFPANWPVGNAESSLSTAVFILVSEGIRVGYYQHETRHKKPDWHYINGNMARPTHWAPIPEDLVAGALAAKHELLYPRWTTTKLLEATARMDPAGRGAFERFSKLVQEFEEKVLLAPAGFLDRNYILKERGVQQPCDDDLRPAAGWTFSATRSRAAS